MKLALYGMGHLGLVFSAGLAELGLDVVAFDPNASLVQNLSTGHLPLQEAGLDDLIQNRLHLGNLKFSPHLASIANFDIVWFTVDTPVKEDDSADVNLIFEEMVSVIKLMRNDSIFVYSSQVPVGTGSALENFISDKEALSSIKIVCVPENLRLGTSLENFRHADRIVIGGSNADAITKIVEFLRPTAAEVITMSLESAEFTKHSINSFLALSVCFANELAALSESAGANPEDVYLGMVSDSRIGKGAYVRPGGPVAGGTLMRDVRFLETMSLDKNVHAPLVTSIWNSNQIAKNWAIRLARESAIRLGRRVVLVGLSYKVDSDSARRSLAVEMAVSLKKDGIAVFLFDSRLDELSGSQVVFGVPLINYQDLSEEFIYVICGPDERVVDIMNLLSESATESLVIDISGRARSAATSRNMKVLRHGQ